MSKSVNSKTNHDENDSNNYDNMLGVSVYWLKTEFMTEVKDAGLMHESKIYEIENLNGQPGVIRNKGKDVISPIDDKKGAAYVHCLQGDDNVGPATVMLSYTWGYTIGMIIETLENWCRSTGKDPKCTYIWMCCLCVNQHRVVEQTEFKKSGMIPSAPSVNFFDEFGHRVKSTGTILSLMEPWESPMYLSRIWCVFEVYWATVHDCNVEIIMPQNQTDLMTKSVVGNSNEDDGEEKTGIDKLYDVLSNIDIEKADASVKEDKAKILNMIRNDCGYRKLNNIVNGLFRSWVRKTIDELVLEKSNEINIDDDKNITTTTSKLDSYGDLCYNVGEIFYRNGEYDESMIMYKKCLDIRLKLYGENHEKTASVYNEIGLILADQGDYDNALIQYEKALKIRLSKLGEDHQDVATSHNDIGTLLSNQGDYNKALIQYEKALTIQLMKLGENHPDVATTYGNIGTALNDKGDYDNALIQFEKALTIKLSTLGDDHPSVATTYNNIGRVLEDKGDYDNALMQYEKTLTIQLSKLGEDHPLVATTYNNIGSVLQDKGDYDDALIQYEKALTIQLSKLGEDHPLVATTYNNIGRVLEDKGDYDDALVQYEKSLTIDKSKLGEDHQSVATTCVNIGSVLYNKGDYDNALNEFNKALKIRRKVFGDDHQLTKDVSMWINIVVLAKMLSRCCCFYF